MNFEQIQTALELLQRSTMNDAERVQVLIGINLDLVKHLREMKKQMMQRDRA